MTIKELYKTSATATSGRQGRARSEDGALDVALSLPRSLGGAGGEGTNPEQLFAAGYAACFGSALRLVASKMKLPAENSTITASVSLGRSDDGKMGLTVALRGHLPGLEREQAVALMEAAHAVCPYSNATRGNIEVALSVE